MLSTGLGDTKTTNLFGAVGASPPLTSTDSENRHDQNNGLDGVRRS